jgi:hypothetical protein
MEKHVNKEIDNKKGKPEQDQVSPVYVILM